MYSDQGVLIFIISLIYLSCSSHEHSPEFSKFSIPEDDSTFQKMMIGQLTGEAGIQTIDSSIYINSRWNENEKTLSLQYLEKIINALGLTAYRHDYTMHNINFGVDLLIEPLKGTNLYTQLLATNNSQEYIVLGAHYDTGAKNVPGAIDNGSGMALITAVLRRFMNLEERKKNLLVVYFDQEEEELVGSTAFAKYLISNNYDVHSVHTFDMIGWDGDNNKEVELELPSQEIEFCYYKHAKKLGIPIYSTSINSTDHYSFIKAGFNAVGLSQAYAKRDNSGHKDTPGDKYHLVNFDYLDSSTELVYQAINDLMNE